MFIASQALDHTSTGTSHNLPNPLACVQDSRGTTGRVAAIGVGRMGIFEEEEDHLVIKMGIFEEEDHLVIKHPHPCRRRRVRKLSCDTQIAWVRP